MSGTAPQPSAAVNSAVNTIFSVVGMALSALTMIPGIQAGVLPIAATALTDLESAYAAYVANPNESLFDAITLIVTKALADVRAILHP